MKELHVLLDYENVQPTWADLCAIAPEMTNVWLFYGPHQNKVASEFALCDKRIAIIPRSGQGKNALDFHISFYLGYLASKHPKAHLIVVANDKGYDPMIAHANLLGFKVERLGYKVKRAPTARSVAKPVAKSVAEAPAPTKLAPKAPAKAVSTSTSKVRPKAPIKASKKAAAKTLQSAVKATQLKKSPVKKAAPKPKVEATTESKDVIRIQKSLSKMGDKAPHKLLSLLKLIENMLGKGSSTERIDSAMQKLERAQVVRVFGDLVLYDRA